MIYNTKNHADYMMCRLLLKKMYLIGRNSLLMKILMGIGLDTKAITLTINSGLGVIAIYPSLTKPSCIK